MSWLSAMRIVLTSIISIASASGIIIAISKWLSEKIATHMSQKMLANNQHKLDGDRKNRPPHRAYQKP